MKLSDLQSNIVKVLLEDVGLRTAWRLSDDSVQIRQPEQPGLGPRNLGNAPLIEVAVTGAQREMLCDYWDILTADVTIRMTVQARQGEVLEFHSDVVAALKRKPEFAIVDVVRNDWTYDMSLTDNETYRVCELNLTVQMTVDESEE